MYKDGPSVRDEPRTVTAAAPAVEESLVDDDRARLTPAQQVERKLVSLLRSTPLPVSQMQKAGPPRPML
jgi:hypothetical protein